MTSSRSSPNRSDRRRRRGEEGAAIIESVFAIVTSFVFVAMVMVLLLWALAEGVVHSAADQGARAGSRIDVDSVAACENRARQALTNMFPGAGPGADVSCSESGGVVTASVQLELGGGIPPFSSVTLNGDASSRKEVAPE